MSEAVNQENQANAPKVNKPVASGHDKQERLKLYFIYSAVAVAGYALTALFFYFFPNPLADKSAVLPIQPTTQIAIKTKPALLPTANNKIDRAPIRSRASSVEPVESSPTAKVNPNNAQLGQNEEPQAPQELPSLMLNGLFFSGKLGYALINNQIVKEGDTIEGAKVVQISLRSVILKFGDSKIVLNNPK